MPIVPSGTTKPMKAQPFSGNFDIDTDLMENQGFDDMENINDIQEVKEEKVTDEIGQATGAGQVVRGIPT